MIAITGATGQLGQPVIENLLRSKRACERIAVVR
ncbi:SDR family oxidoreductase [Salmonella enterica subsp. enterica serovar Kentucky]